MFFGDVFEDGTGDIVRFEGFDGQVVLFGVGYVVEEDAAAYYTACFCEV